MWQQVHSSQGSSHDFAQIPLSTSVVCVCVRADGCTGKGHISCSWQLADVAVRDGMMSWGVWARHDHTEAMFAPKAVAHLHMGLVYGGFKLKSNAVFLGDDWQHDRGRLCHISFCFYIYQAFTNISLNSVKCYFHHWLSMITYNIRYWILLVKPWASCKNLFFYSCNLRYSWGEARGIHYNVIFQFHSQKSHLRVKVRHAESWFFLQKLANKEITDSVSC